MTGRTARRGDLLVQTDILAVLEAYAEGRAVGAGETAVPFPDAALLLFQECVNQTVVTEHKTGLLDSSLSALIVLIETLAHAFEIGTHILLLLVLGEETAVTHGLVLGLVETVHGKTGEDLQEVLVELPADDDVGFRSDNGHLARRAVIETTAQVELTDDVHQLEFPGVAILVGIGNAVRLHDTGDITILGLLYVAHLEVILQQELLYHPGCLVRLAGGTDLLGTVLQLQQFADLGNDIFSFHILTIRRLLDKSLTFFLCIQETVTHDTVDELARPGMVKEIHALTEPVGIVGEVLHEEVTQELLLQLDVVNLQLTDDKRREFELMGVRQMTATLVLPVIPVEQQVGPALLAVDGDLETLDHQTLMNKTDQVMKILHGGRLLDLEDDLPDELHVR